MDVYLFLLWIAVTVYVLWACDWIKGKKWDHTPIDDAKEKAKPVYREDINWNQWGR